MWLVNPLISFPVQHHSSAVVKFSEKQGIGNAEANVLEHT